jgi:hypothetical protein
MRFLMRGFRVLLLLPVVVPVAATRPLSAQAGEPSPAYKAALRRTAELRKQRRRSPAPAPVGVIVPYPMPPSLIIRQTPEVHDEIEGLLRLLRGSTR